MKLINCLNPDFSKLKYKDNILDPLHYIEGEKKIFQFINSDLKLFKVKVPINITKSDLYTIGKKYKSMFNSKFLLIFNDCILEEDESSIDIIPDNGKIIIIEDRIFPDDTYYNSLIEKNKMERKTIFIIEGHYSTTISLPSNITFFELKKAIHFKLGYNLKNLFFLNFYNNENDKVPEICKRISISIAGKGVIGTYIEKYGKSVNCELFIRNNRFSNIDIGLLNSNRNLIDYIETILEKKVTKMFFNEKEINIYHEKSLSSLGIKDNFKCTIETKPKK